MAICLYKFLLSLSRYENSFLKRKKIIPNLPDPIKRRKKRKKEKIKQTTEASETLNLRGASV